SVQLIRRPCEIAGECLNVPDAVDPLMQAFSFFKLHLRARPIARGRGCVDERCAIGAKEVLHPRRFTAIFIDGYSLLARPKTAVHLAVNAAGMIGRRRQILLAAADLEQVEHGSIKAFRCSPARKRSVEETFSETRGNHGSGEWIIERQ